MSLPGQKTKLLHTVGDRMENDFLASLVRSSLRSLLSKPKSVSLQAVLQTGLKGRPRGHATLGWFWMPGVSRGRDSNEESPL